MGTSPNLGITLISSSQSQKEVTANAATNALDGATQGELPIGNGNRRRRRRRRKQRARRRCLSIHDVRHEVP